MVDFSGNRVPWLHPNLKWLIAFTLAASAVKFLFAAATRGAGIAVLPFLAIAADAGTVYLLWRLLAPPTEASIAALIAVALSPLTILTSGVQGSTDAVMTFFLVLAVLLLERNVHPALAGAAFGTSMSFHLFPLLLLPGVAAWLPDIKKRAMFSAPAAAVMLAAFLSPLWPQPAAPYGNWGISRLLGWLSAAGFAAPDELFHAAGEYIIAGVMAGAGLWVKRRYPGSPLSLRIALLAVFFLLVTPGFGVKHLAWVAPWAALAGSEAAMLFGFSGMVFIVSVYNYWSQDWPWELENALDKPPWSGVIIGYELLCYASLVVLFVVLKSRMVTPRSGGENITGRRSYRSAVRRR
ncbi:MAG TPA: hypothetical protein VM120_29585 [Bryobacteraceae bacterium]|nr:hypothetical protein [Bryobacteraceae bacterium]